MRARKEISIFLAQTPGFAPSRISESGHILKFDSIDNFSFCTRTDPSRSSAANGTLTCYVDSIRFKPNTSQCRVVKMKNNNRTFPPPFLRRPSNFVSPETYRYKWLWTASRRYDIRCTSDWCNTRPAPAACIWPCSLPPPRYSPSTPCWGRRWSRPAYRHPRCTCPR